MLELPNEESALPIEANKPVLMQLLGHQGQQTHVGAHKIQGYIFGDAKMRSWIPGDTLNDNKLQLLQLCNSKTI